MFLRQLAQRFSITSLENKKFKFYKLKTKTKKQFPSDMKKVFFLIEAFEVFKDSEGIFIEKFFLKPWKFYYNFVVYSYYYKIIIITKTEIFWAFCRTISSYHCKLRFMWSTGLTCRKPEQVVQYTYMLYEEKRDGTPN